MGQVVDLFLVYQFVKRISTPFKNTKAFELGLIDEKGKLLKSPKSSAEKDAYTYYDRLIFNLKRLINKIPFLENRFVTFAAALFLLKEQNVTYVSDSELQKFITENFTEINKLLKEDAAVNNVGSGNIAGINDGSKITKRILDRHRKRNLNQSKRVINSFYNFNKG
jgi:hypothetical protein